MSTWREVERFISQLASGEAFRQQRFAEDDDAEYFLRCQRVIQRQAVALTPPAPSDAGFVMVPREPTEAMIQAAYAYVMDPHGWPGEGIRVWKAMLSAAPKPASGDDEVERSRALADITVERRRQIEAEGWTPEHDDQHADGGHGGHPALPQAAACYALGEQVRWPWAEEWWKPGPTRRRDLIKAAALLVAEIERLDRAALKGDNPHV